MYSTSHHQSAHMLIQCYGNMSNPLRNIGIHSIHIESEFRRILTIFACQALFSRNIFNTFSHRFQPSTALPFSHLIWCWCCLSKVPFTQIDNLKPCHVPDIPMKGRNRNKKNKTHREREEKKKQFNNRNIFQMTHLKLCLNTYAKKNLATKFCCVGMCVLRKIGTLAKLYALCLRLTKTPREKTDDIILIESILSFKYLTNFMENFWTVRFFFLFFS